MRPLLRSSPRAWRRAADEESEDPALVYQKMQFAAEARDAFNMALSLDAEVEKKEKETSVMLERIDRQRCKNNLKVARRMRRRLGKGRPGQNR